MQYSIIQSKVVNDKSLHKYYNLHDILVQGPIFRSTAAAAAKSLSRVRLLATPWTAAYQAPPSMGFSRQQYWSGVPLSSPQKH